LKTEYFDTIKLIMAKLFYNTLVWAGGEGQPPPFLYGKQLKEEQKNG